MHTDIAHAMKPRYMMDVSYPIMLFKQLSVRYIHIIPSQKKTNHKLSSAVLYTSHCGES